LRSSGLIKVVTESKKRGVDPVGACIGVGAARIKSISRALFPERIDIVSLAKEKEILDNRDSFPKEIGSYKNIQIRTSVEKTSERKGSF
jgi:hypothetical protein